MEYIVAIYLSKHILNTPLLLLLPGLLWPGMVAPDRALSMGYIELTASLCLMKLNTLK